MEAPSRSPPRFRRSAALSQHRLFSSWLGCRRCFEVGPGLAQLSNMERRHHVGTTRHSDICVFIVCGMRSLLRSCFRHPPPPGPSRTALHRRDAAFATSCCAPCHGMCRWYAPCSGPLPVTLVLFFRPFVFVSGIRGELIHFFSLFWRLPTHRSAPLHLLAHQLKSSSSSFPSMGSSSFA